MDIRVLPGLSNYSETYALQETLVQKRVRDEIPDTLLLLEHSPVITVGRARGAAENVLTASDTPVVKVARGGDVTWHGPGQLVAYPIIKLEGHRKDLHRHLHSLEDAVITLLEELGLSPHRDPRNTGVWLKGKKVCSIGIGCRKWVTWHGLALNVTPNLDVFTQINPCGFEASIMTRLEDHLTPCPDVRALMSPLALHLASALDAA